MLTECCETEVGAAIPPQCDPAKSLDWRLQLGDHLAKTTNARPIVHADPWVQEAGNFLAACYEHGNSHQPTLTDLAIVEALRLSQANTLEQVLLEARLMAHEQPDDIAGRSGLSRLTVAAYMQLIFDVADRHRLGPCILRPTPMPKVKCKAILKIGAMLRRIAMFEGSDVLEEYIEVLLRIEGPTLAHGLPDRQSPNRTKELKILQEFALNLLGETRSVHRLLERFGEAATAGGMSEQTVAVTAELLAKAKIPAVLQKEIARLRAHSKPAVA